METLTDKQRERALNKFLYYKTYFKKYQQEDKNRAKILNTSKEHYMKIKNDPLELQQRKERNRQAYLKLKEDPEKLKKIRERETLRRHERQQRTTK